MKKLHFLFLGTLIFQNFLFGQCVVGDPDSDGDGVCDAADICPGFDDDMDIDNDGIVYCLDTCVDVNENGICDHLNDPDTITNNLKIYFSHKRGFYSSAFQLELIPNDPNAIIRYQIGNNPSLPTLSSGNLYSGPIDITASSTPNLFDTDAIQTIKVIGYTSVDTTKVYSHSYLFYNPQNTAAVVVSDGYDISHPLDEACVSFEFLAPHSMGLKGKQEYAGIRHNDNSSYGVRNSPKFYFRELYGAGTFKADLFSDEFYGTIKPTEIHDQLYLRYVHQDVLNYRQKLELDLMAMAGSLSPQSKYVVYFKNGEVYGVRQLKERPDGGYMEEYIGGQKEDYDAYGAHANAAWIPPSPSVLQDYNLLFSEYYDFSNIVAFNFLNSIGGDSQNDQFRVVFPVVPNQPIGAKTYFWNWDVDFVDGIYNGIDDFTLTLNSLNTNVDFVSDYGDKLHCLCFNDGPLSQQNWMNHQNYLWSQRNIAYGLIGNYTYGGSQYTQINQNSQKPPPTLSVLQNSYTEYFNNMAGQHNIYKTSPVEYNVYGGQVAAGFQLILTNPNNYGSIYYTLDGTDPRVSGGGLSPSAQLYSGPINFPQGVYKVVARIFDPSNSDEFAKWSPMCPRYFYADIDTSYYDDLVINEIHYNPNDTIFFNPVINSLDTVSGRNLEFVEIKNNGPTPIVISNVSMTRGIEYTESAYIEIQPGEFLVYAEDLFWFEQKYGLTPNGKYTGKLENSGEKILLEDPFGTVIDSVRYNDKAPWPGTADKGYYSLALLDAGLDNSDGNSWSIQSVLTTPGKENYFSDLGVHDFSGVVFNEIHYHPFDSIDVLTGESITSRKFEFIELHNITDFDIDLSGAFISRGVDYTFPEGACIKANDFLILVEDKSSFFDRYGFQAFDKYDGKLDNSGETLWLNAKNGSLLDVFTYGDSFPWDFNADGGTTDNSLALIDPTVNNDTWINWKVQCNNTLYTPGSANEFACITPSDFSGLTISEIHYAPAGGTTQEFIEITNTNMFVINLEELNLSNAVTYVFDNLFLLPGQQIVVANDSTDFHNTYGFAPTGVYSGELNDFGETILLKDLFGNLIDSVSYSSLSPWDTEASFGNKSLALLDPVLNNSSATSWCVQDVASSPGLPNTFIDLDNNGIADCNLCADYVNELGFEQIQSDTTANISILTNGIIMSGMDVSYSAGISIELLIDFQVEQGAVFHAYIAPCVTP